MNDQQIEFDRMVDGELDFAHQRTLLLTCEAQNSWRELALAYVESQTLGSELNMLSGQNSHSESVGRIGGSRSTRSYRSTVWNPFVLAAAVLLSLGIGYGFGWRWQQDAHKSPLVGLPARAGSSGATKSTNDSGAQFRSMQFTVVNPMTNELLQIELPIVNASDLGPNWREQLRSDLPADLLREMRAGGLNVRQTQTMTPVRLSDGTHVVVPIDYYFEQPYQ